jgi:hypothetical protein
MMAQTLFIGKGEKSTPKYLAIIKFLAEFHLQKKMLPKDKPIDAF